MNKALGRLHLLAVSMGAAMFFALPAHAVVLWSDLGATLALETGAGTDILGGAVKEDDSSTNTLYFKFHVDPLSDTRTELYFAAFQLYEGDTERLGVGNSMNAWAYGAFNTDNDYDANKVSVGVALNTSRPEPLTLGNFLTYELPRRGIECTLVFKVQYVPNGHDLVTVWLNPDLTPGATEESQSTNLVTAFKADASFNQIRLRHGGGGGGWMFSDMAIATSFSDFVQPGGIEPGEVAPSTARDGRSLSFRFWQREQGLPQNSVQALAQTRDGYLWVGTDDGVAHFDGLRFVSFGLRDGLHSGPVRILFGDSSGALWIGSKGAGLTRFQNGHFTKYTTQDGLPSDSITALAEGGNDQIWVGTESGLVVWQGEKLAPVSGAEKFKGKSVTALFKDRHGIMWVGVKGAGVFEFQGGKFNPLADAAVEDLLQDPHCLLVDQNGRLWVGAGDDFVLCRDGGEWHRYRIPHHLARPYVSALAEEPNGTVWAGSVGEGLFQFKGDKLTTVNASSGLSDNLVGSLLIDREGKLWVGTDAGLNLLQRKNLFAFSQNEGLGYGAVQGLAEITPGTIWAGKPGDGLYQWEGKNFSRLAGGSLSGRDVEVNSLLMTRDGSCWLASANGLLHLKDPKAYPAAAESIELPGMNVTALSEDQQGSLWAGTHEGKIWRLRNGKWEAQTNLFQIHTITAIVLNDKSGLWIGTEGGGLCRFKDGRPARFDTSNGLLSDSIRTLYLDGKDTLWIGTAGGGLSRWHDGHIANFTTREGLPDNTISQILEDDTGCLWLGSNRGIACISKHELEEMAAGTIHAVYPRVYGQAEGMLSEECTGGYYPAGLKTKSGLLWFSTLKGIVVVDPRLHTVTEPPPLVALEEVLVDGTADPKYQVVDSAASVHDQKSGRKESETETLQIPPGKHRIELRYTALSFSAPERVRFRYRLEGLDSDWVEAGTRRTAFYSYVPPGNYLFRVIVCNSDGVWSDTGVSLALTVVAYFWQTWWFLGLATLAFFILVGSLIRIVEKNKVRRRLEHLEQERALQRERARIARDLHDDLGSSLARISLLGGLVKVDKEHPDQVEIHARKISQSADQTVRALEEIVWAVRPGSDSLQSLVEYIVHFANELFEDNTTRCRLDLPHDLPAQPLPPEVRHNIFLVVKEALTNTLKHAAAREVYVQAKVSANRLELSIRDDGRGFDPFTPPQNGSRHGLGNMRRRAEAMGGTLTLQSAPGKGTTIQLAINFPARADTRGA